jgi:threonine synthase
MAFKDVGARFMSPLFGIFQQRQKTKYSSSATSGDTGGAVAEWIP